MSNKGGRPLTFKTVEKLQEKIDEYFRYCDDKTKEIHSEKLGDMIVPDPEPYTMAGLAYELGISRQALMEYSKRDKFGDAIKRARNKVEADVERRMNGKDTFTPGLIFNAKNNFGWKDRSEVDNNVRFPKPLLSNLDVRDNDSTEETEGTE